MVAMQFSASLLLDGFVGIGTRSAFPQLSLLSLLDRRLAFVFCSFCSPFFSPAIYFASVAVGAAVAPSCLSFCA